MKAPKGFAQREVFAIIVKYYRENGYPPTIHEIAAIRCCSGATVYRVIRRLVHHGFVKAGDLHSSRQYRPVIPPVVRIPILDLPQRPDRATEGVRHEQDKHEGVEAPGG